MSNRTHKEIVRRLLEDGFGRGDADVIAELMAPDAVGHAPPDEFHGPADVTDMVAAIHRGFPDVTVEVQDLVAADGLAVARWTMRGTHEGPFQGVPATGTRIETGGVTIERIEDGQIVEGWTYRDLPGLLAQLGAVPASGAE